MTKKFDTYNNFKDNFTFSVRHFPSYFFFLLFLFEPIRIVSIFHLL